MKILYLTLKSEVYSAQRLSEAAQARGHEVLHADPDQFQLSVSGAGAALFLQGEPVGGVDVVLPRLGPTVREHAFGVLRAFELQGTLAVNSLESLLKARDKLATAQYLSAAGLPVSRTLLVKTAKEFRQLAHLLPTDKYVIKLPVGVQGIGIMLAESRAAAESILDAMWGLRNTVIVQECLPDATREDKRVFVLGGQVIAAMRRTAAEGGFRSNIHRGGQGHKTELASEEERLAAKAATALGLEIAGVDIAHSDAGPVILEVNASPGIEGLEKATGVDAASEIIGHIERLFRERKAGGQASP